MEQALFELLYAGYVLTYTLFLCGVFLSLFTHAWVKGGYTGKNKILEIHEVTAFVAHVCAAVGIVTFVAMCFVEPLLIVHLKIGYSPESKWGVLLIGMGSGAYAAFRKQIARKLLGDMPVAKEEEEQEEETKP